MKLRDIKEYDADGSCALTEIACGKLSGAVVWQVDAVSDYVPFARLFAGDISVGEKKLVYFRFPEQSALLKCSEGMQSLELNPQAGFEPFIDAIVRKINSSPKNSHYLFDCLSPLAADWFSDQMVGNFFVIVGAQLRLMQGHGCFAILRNHHSQYAIEPITHTAPALLDVYRYNHQFYVQPLKLEGETISGQHRLHVYEKEQFTPVLDSHTASAVLTRSRRDNLGLARHHLGIWSRTFVEAEALLSQSDDDPAHYSLKQAMRDRILRMAVTRDARVLHLVQRYFSLEDLVFLGTRMLGTGLIGGKATDMLLARAALLREDECWETLLEAHDSFFIPSDVFYTFLVQNECWELRRQLIHAPDRLDIAMETRRRILKGNFPLHIMKRLSDMLDYYGESPLAVRSSSLLEDSFGNAFSGRYESVFCINQGDRAQRIDELVAAIKTVYASAMSKAALEYRSVHKLLENDEQMAILVQRVAGSFHGSYFFPHVAAVGFSFNPYVWHEDIDPRAGVLRLVFGLGTRAVNRSDDDYTRLVALNAPMLRPDPDTDTGMPAPAQQWAEALDLEQGKVTAIPFKELAPLLFPATRSLLASEDQNVLRAARQHGIKNPFALRLSFEGLLSNGDFATNVQRMLSVLEHAYGTPVDIEFTVHFGQENNYRIHLLQCRPMQVRGLDHPMLPSVKIAQNAIILRGNGPVIGRSRFLSVEKIIYVVPKEYSRLSEREQYAVARLIGEINRRVSATSPSSAMVFIGPGRWGSTTPSLGLPVSFIEINRAVSICELLALRDDLVTEVSLGAHFFNDLVELDILYMAITPNEKNSIVNTAFLENAPNHITALIPEAARFEQVIRLIQAEPGEQGPFFLIADTMKQHVYLYRG